MSEYQDYFFSDESRQEELSMLNSPLMNQKNFPEISFLDDNEFNKHIPPTLDINDVTELDFSSEKKQTFVSSNEVKKSKRIKRSINVSEEHKLKRKQIFKGLKDDTIQLNPNFKTIFSKKLKELTLLRQIGAQDKALIHEFSKKVPSFKGIKILCKSKNIRQKGLNFLKSSKIVEEILCGQGKMTTKMTMLKYLECLKQNLAEQKVTKWKSIGFE